MLESENHHCSFREEDGTCAILSQASSFLREPHLERPVCQHPKKSKDECPIAEEWYSIPDEQILSGSGSSLPMGEID